MTMANLHSEMEFPDWLFLLFLGLKLHGSLRWSWWFVFSPLIVQVTALSVRSGWRMWKAARLAARLARLPR
jgi:hypothetical protein